MIYLEMSDIGIISANSHLVLLFDFKNKSLNIR